MMTMRWMDRWLLVCGLLLALACSEVGCSDQATAPAGAQVVFDRWQSYGSNGAVGIVVNNGTKAALAVRIKTENQGATLVSGTTPGDIAPGARASFAGAGSGPGLIAHPTIVWIRWD